VYVARILLWESCKFGEKICYSNRDDEFFLRDCFYWHTLYIQFVTLMASFIRNVQKVIEPIRGFTKSFMDDLIVHSRTKYGEKPFTIHLQHISAVNEGNWIDLETVEVQILPT